MNGKRSAVFRSYIHAFHVYKDIWEPVIDQVLSCIQEPETPEDKIAVALMNKEKIIGHVPKNISIWMTIFLKLKNSYVASRVTGEKVSRGGGYGLEIPWEYLVEGD